MTSRVLSRMPPDYDPFENDPAHTLRIWVRVFDVISAVGFLLLGAVFFTALLSPSVKRISTWYANILAWMVFCITPFLVVGHQTHLDPPPSFSACVVDSALMYASRPLAAFSSLALVLHLFFNVSTQLKHGEARPQHVFLLLIIPPLLYIIFFLWTLMLGLLYPDLVELEPSGFYCHLKPAIPAIVVAAFVAFTTSCVIVLEVITGVLLYRNWRAFRALHMRHEHSVSLSILIRASAFGVLPMIGLALSFTTYVPNLVDKIFPAYNILLASLPTAAALIFGSQMDLIRVWIFWRRVPKVTDQTVSSTAFTSDVP
ncbi:hypothetical protein B0H10DRAFT_660474 [Mycena sp. CBHHK59/15]|nr:hypothetical protein B0H10DRAFT_660474 [Mycena sp. CBHHK59/15]